MIAKGDVTHGTWLERGNLFFPLWARVNLFCNLRLTRSAALVMISLTTLTSCSERGDVIQQNRTIMTIGLLPHENENTLRARYQPLAAYLERAIGLPCRLVVPASYDDFVRTFSAGTLDFAMLGGFTFVAVREATGALPLVMRDEDLVFTSYYLVRPENTATRLEDLKDASFSFGSQLSTSGHLMPRFFMHTRGIDPEVFFTALHFSGSHDRTAYMVRDGVVAAGVASAEIIDQMFSDGRLLRSDVRILEQSPHYADYVWAAHPQSPAWLREKFIDALLALSLEDPEHREILQLVSARRFERSAGSDFDSIQSIARDLGMLKEPAQ